MMKTLRATTFLLATTLVLGATGLGPSAGAGSQAPDGQADSQTSAEMTQFRWESPLDLEGNFVAVFRLESNTQQTRCQSIAEAEGTVRDDDPHLLLFTRHHNAARRGGGTFRNQETVSAHAAGVVDTRPVLGILEDGKWDMGFVGATVFGGNDEPDDLWITVAAFGLDNREGPPPRPLTIDITCDDPVQMSIFAGRHAIDLTRQTLKDGGAGVSVFDANGPALYVLSQEEEFFDTSMVWFQADFRPDDWIAPGFTYATFDLHHPDGTESWKAVVGPEDPHPWRHKFWMQFTGPSGAYTLEMTLAGASHDNLLRGILAGLDPVQSLDEVV